MDACRTILLGFALLLPALASAGSEQDSPATIYETVGDYDMVRAFLFSEIEGRGLVINRVGDVNAMLGRTAGAVGATTTAFLHAEAVLFCKADLSHNITHADPRNVVLCPYSIVIYETRAEPGVIKLGYRSTGKTFAAVRVINRLLKEIILATIGF